MGAPALELKPLSADDPVTFLEMLREIGPGENGFRNSGYKVSDEEWPVYLRRQSEEARGIGLPAGRVPQTIYWLLADGEPVGITKLRDRLTSKLRVKGGHVGFCIRPTRRGEGLGNELLRLTLREAERKRIMPVLVTCDEPNIPSRAVIESNGGVLSEIDDGVCRYWIEQRE